MTDLVPGAPAPVFPPFTPTELALTCDGRLVRDGARPVSGASIDSRTLRPGNAFFALPGSRADGHDFLAAAAAAGASVLVVIREAAVQAVPEGPAVVLVEDGAKALAALAARARALLLARVAAVTGSCGKTTTKEMLAAALSAAGETAASPASYNNQLGVPLTLLAAAPGAAYLVLELGTSRPGELKELALLARPEVAVITNIGPAHLAGLGSLEGVARAKAEILEGLAEGGTAVLSTGDPHSRRLARRLRAAGRTVLTFGEGGDLAVRELEIASGQAALVTSDGARWPLAGSSRTAAAAALAAISAARALGVSDGRIATGLERWRPLPMRLELRSLPGGVTLINDAYNANPLSVAAALERLAELGAGRRKVAVLGEMLELGRRRGHWHAVVGRQAGAVADLVWAVGASAAATARGVAESGKQARSCPAPEEAAGAIAATVQDGDVVLVKGSRAMAMERVARAIEDARRAALPAGLATTGATA